MATVLLFSAFLILSFTCGYGLRSYMSQRRYAATPLTSKDSIGDIQNCGPNTVSSTMGRSTFGRMLSEIATKSTTLIGYRV